MSVHKFAICNRHLILVAGSVTSGFGLLAMTGRSQPRPGASPPRATRQRPKISRSPAKA